MFSLFKLRSLLYALLLCLGFQANAQLYLNITAQGGGNVGDTITAYTSVAGFTDFNSAQFSVNWDPSVLAFVGVDGFGIPGMNSLNFNTMVTSQGLLGFAWYDQTFQGATLPDCSGLFNIRFTRLSAGPANLVISSIPVVIEATNDNGVVNVVTNAGPCTTSTLSGKIFFDDVENCAFDNGEIGLAGWHISVTNGTNTYTTTTDTDGNYSFDLVVGNYELTAITPNGLWTLCQNSYNLLVSGNTVQDIPAQAAVDCPLMEVHIAVPSLRPCFDKTYQVMYCNNGTVPAADASVQISFDPFFMVFGADIPWSSANGNTYTFPLGTVGVGECGSFGVQIFLYCNTTVGRAHCTTAHAFPDANCLQPDPAWDEAHLKVNGACNDSLVHFTILNEGADMAAPTWYNVIRDGSVELFNEPLQLASGASLELDFPADGATYRVEALQSAHHPWSQLPSATIEACGVSSIGGFSLGYFTQYPQDDSAPFLDIDCRESTNSFDPNDKKGFPKGYCGNYVGPTVEMEYTIRFQNTGTDTAYEVVLLDTLSSAFDPLSIQPGASSHPYSFSLKSGNVAEFRFTGINLPDASTNADASQGFVQYRIAQTPNNADGTSLDNKAAIYFDLNAPIITNEVQNTVRQTQLHATAPATVTDASTPTSFDGSITVGSLAGGIPPYAYSLNGEPGGPVFGNLPHGNYLLTVTDASNCQIFETLVVSFGSAIPDANARTNSVHLQPNPVQAGSKFQLVFANALQGPTEVKIVDPTGRLVSSQKLVNLDKANALELTAPLVAGVYFVEIWFPNQARQVLRLVVI